MAPQEIHSWTFGGLIGAFVDLVVAYFLLCGSAVAFFASKFLRVLGISFPCPCKGVFGYKNSNLCLRKVIFEWPSRKICSIQVMAVKRFPFDLVRAKDHSCNSNEKLTAERTSGNRALELEDEASCSSCSGPSVLSLVDRESGYDDKGKRIMNLKRRSGIRRRRRATYKCGKLSSVFPSENLWSDATRVTYLPYDGDIIRDKTGESLNSASGKEANVLDVEDAQTSHDIDERACNADIDSPGQDEYSSSQECLMSNGQDKMQNIAGNEDDRIMMLEQAIEEEKDAYATLCLELEKERAAAATAADEAMAMILRLQEEKAIIEMETRQYQRMIEELVGYEEEEMGVLQEIIIRREMENHFLEKELEAYRQTSVTGGEQSNSEPKVLLDDWGQRPSFSLETHDDPLNKDSTISVVKKGEIANLPSNYMVTQECNRTEDGEELGKNTEHYDQAGGNFHDSYLGTEPDVLDVHVIDDKIEPREEDNGKICSSSFNSTANEPRDGDLAFGSLGVQRSNIEINCPRTSKAESDISFDGPSSQLSELSNPRYKTLPFDFGRDSSYADNNRKIKIGTEIGMLVERLRMLKLEKGKLNLFPENGESRKGELKLLEEILNQLQEIKQLRSPSRRSSLPPSRRVSLTPSYRASLTPSRRASLPPSCSASLPPSRRASLPPSSAKVSLKKRHRRSATWKTFESA